MPRPNAANKQAALEELVMAALAIATRYRTDCAQRPNPPRERFTEPGTGLERENGFTVPVALLNRLATASRGFAGLMALPSGKPAPRRIGPMHVLVDEDQGS